MNKTHLIGALCAGSISFLAMSSPSLAVTADNVKCDKCVGAGDIAKKAVTSSRIKPGAVTGSKIKDGAVTKSKLSGGVLDLIDSSKRYVIVDANDQAIGTAIGGDIGEPVIITPQGYHAEVNVNDGEVHIDIQVFYTDVNCAGTAYMDLLGSLEGTITSGDRFLEQDEAAVGAVFNADDTGIEYWYVPYISTLVSDIPVQSVWLYDDDTETVVCDVVSGTITTAAEVFQNDPAITGFPNDPFLALLRYDYR